MTTSPKVSAESVAVAFLKQYYTTLSQKPQDLHKFYRDESNLTISFGKGDESVISG
jgi:hypothetical protein